MEHDKINDGLVQIVRPTISCLSVCVWATHFSPTQNRAGTRPP
jgi:hypothetical protein